ncbi:MAG: hypothetical protein IPH37_18240 [Burkholderiales bacterium]|nr:hypothetical protein [Burkholderiales bacterium]
MGGTTWCTRQHRRELPFDLSLLEDLNPRLADAGPCCKRGAVQLVNASPLEATRTSADGSYRVREHGGPLRCTCPWFAEHQGEPRAVQTQSAGSAGLCGDFAAMTQTRSKPFYGTPLGRCILAGDITRVMDAVDAVPKAERTVGWLGARANDGSLETDPHSAGG